MKIVVDSACDLSQDMKDKKDINIDSVPLTLQLGDDQYIDDDTLDINAYLEEMYKTKDAPKTAAPSPDLYLEKYKGKESIFVVTLSKHLSASYSNAVLAKDMYLDEIGDKFIHVFDSIGASATETVIALKINELIKEKLSENDIVENINTFIKNMGTYFILENYNNLVKNGRMNPYIAKVASMLSIKPICYSDFGKIGMLDKARGFNKAVSKMVDYILKEHDNFEERVLGISHVRAPEKALAFKDEISKAAKFKDIIIVEASGLCSTYADDGGLVVAL